VDERRSDFHSRRDVAFAPSLGRRRGKPRGRFLRSIDVTTSLELSVTKRLSPLRRSSCVDDATSPPRTRLLRPRAPRPGPKASAG